MNNYLLNNYNLSKWEVLQSLFVSEYGLRHLAHSKTQSQYKWGHRIIAAIELCPVIGLIASIIEGLIARCIRSNNIEAPSHPKSPSQTSLIRNRQWLFKGAQTGCTGAVLIAKVESIRAKLDIERSIGIQFNQEKIIDFLEGGTCTAMSLEFLDSYFNAKKINIKKPGDRSGMLLDHLVKLNQKFSSSSEEMRNRQAAYNTIEVQLDSSLGDPVDYSKNKIQSLANYHSFVIDYSSSEIDINKLDHEAELSKEVEALPEGAFLVRILKPADNEKLEEHGHSLVYIKEHGLGLFYDPNYGARNLSSSEHPKILFEGFKSCFQSFGVSKARFYRFQPA